VLLAGDSQEAVRLASATPVELCLFAQARPGRFRQEDVEQLHRAAPLARLGVLLGAWCEGELRTADRPLSGVVRIYWHEWEAKLAAWWNSPCEAAATWSLPRTALAGERTLAATTMPATEDRPLAAIRARGGVSFSTLAETCRAAGFAAVWLDPQQMARIGRTDLVLWEGDVRHAHELDELERLARELHPAPTLALVSFPRREDRRLALAAGAVDLIAKPFLVADLVRRMHLALQLRIEHDRHARS
jgi:CheY-like chemotaxis protein